MKRTVWLLIGLLGLVIGCSPITEPSAYTPDLSKISQQQQPQDYNNPCGCPRPQPHGKSGDQDTLSTVR